MGIPNFLKERRWTYYSSFHLGILYLTWILDSSFGIFDATSSPFYFSSINYCSSHCMIWKNIGDTTFCMALDILGFSANF
ncbi:hypothetical protein NPIL_567931 [Nephila pilipes]|uniref:Uncharacterized protein n=1 Tax=Nephila pilipes TaxID=299642 RepID=A0A8X6PNR6_NEPPI|nr:hypothetical protein NPIL_567931 [Nephila pilipes]